MSAPPSPSSDNQSTGQVGVLMALTAFGWWALVTPLYFHVLDSIPASEQLAWRVISGLPAMVVILLLGRQFSQLITILRSPRVLLLLVFYNIFFLIIKVLGTLGSIFIPAVHHGKPFGARALPTS